MPHRFLACGLAVAAAGTAFATGDQPPVTNHAGEFVLRLTPRPLQRDPRIDMAVITEMTDAGRHWPSPSAGAPIYYISQAAGYHDEGEGLRGLTPLSVAGLQINLERALRASGFAPATTGHPASLAIFFHWGSANEFDSDVEGAAAATAASGLAGQSGYSNAGFAASSPAARKALLARAALVGGTTFAQGLAEALMKDDMMPYGLGPRHIAVEEYMNKSYKNRQLMEEARSDCYYVVASAYDASALAHGKRVLLWRTKMTTSSQGIAMSDALPTLIRGGTGYFGREMSEAATLTGHLIPEGQVQIGTPKQVRDNLH